MNKDTKNNGRKPKSDTPKIGIEDIKKESEKLLKNSKEAIFSDNLKKILATHEKLKILKASDIVFSEPVLKQNGNGVIFRNSIITLQGQAGVHKSRLAEIISAVFLKLQSCNNDLLGFTRTDVNEPFTVVYVDTERNLSEQFPFALQQIQIKAGYEKAEHPVNFEYISLLQIDRKDRYQALNEYLAYIKETTKNPLFIVLDVSTDCIEDFNKTDKSMELIDMMNMTINEHDVIFLCIIHENPKSEKARGHFGTELMNKSSTVMQVSFEKDENKNDTDIIRVKYLKCRSTARHTPFYIKYSEDKKGLVLADTSEVSGIVNNRKHKAPNEDIIDHIEMYLGDRSTLPRVDLLDKLCAEFKTKQRTIETRIKEIIEAETEIFDEKGTACKLTKFTQDKSVFYKLITIETF